MRRKRQAFSRSDGHGSISKGLMDGTTYSMHARQRMRQRGRRDVDVELVLLCGSKIGEDVYFLGAKDADREIRRRKQEIQRLERLRNWKVVVADDSIVTCYRSDRPDQRLLLRRGRERA